MKRSALSILITFVFAVVSASAQTSAFTYQGKLSDGGTAANGQYDLTFKLYASGGSQIGSDVAVNDVQVTAGIFTVNLDFGSLPFTNDTARLLEIAVRPGSSSGAYTTLSPRQPITSSPFSIKTVNATSADSLSTACVLCITDAHIVAVDGAKVTGTVGNATVAAVAGNVSGVVAVRNGGTGSEIKNFVDLTTTQRRIEGDKEFLGTVSVEGAAGVFSGNGSGLTNLNGANLTNGSVTAAKLAPDALTSPPSDMSLLATLRWDLLRSQNTFAVGPGPGAIAFDGANIWVTNGNSSTVTKLRASDGANLGTFSVGFNPSAITFDGANIWAANQSSTSVTRLRASDGACVGTCTFSTGATPSGIAFDGANIWVANFGDNTVTKLRASDGSSQGTFPCGTNPYAVAFDGVNIWVANRGSSNVTKLRASDGANLGTFAVGSGPSAIVFDGNSIWIANTGGGLTKLKSDGTSLGTFPFPAGSNLLGVAFDGSHIWVSNGSSFFNSVTKLRASDGVNLGTFPAGSAPRGLAFDGKNMWVANSSGGSVTRLPPAFP